MTNLATLEVVNQFFRQLGIDALNWDGAPVTLTFEQLGTLHIELSARGLTLALAHEIDEYNVSNIAAKALRLIHVDQQLPFPIAAGLRGTNTLLFIITLKDSQQTIASLNEALERLDYLHDQLKD